MPKRCKQLFELSMEGHVPDEAEAKEKNYTVDDLEFLQTKRDLSDFTYGLAVPGKLYPKRIRGGVLLVEGYYEMR